MRKLLSNALYSLGTIIVGNGTSLFYYVKAVIALANFLHITGRVFTVIASGASLAENGHNEKCGDYFFHNSNV